MVKRHEVVDARLWEAGAQRWHSLHPFITLELPHITDWTIGLGSLTLPGNHPQSAALNRVRAGIPLPVSFEVNGVKWSGQITSAALKSEKGAPPVWECKIESDDKHSHRLLARDTAVSAADLTSTRLQGWLGDVTHQLVASAAQRTGLPVYVLVEGEGDPIDVEARTEDTIHDVLQDATVGSRLHLDVRMLQPGDPLPGVGEISHYSGVMERMWQEAQLEAGLWPHAETHPRIVGKAAPNPQLLLPSRSWRGEGTVNINGEVLGKPTAGICWVPFETRVTQPADYFATVDPAGVRVTTEAELRAQQDDLPGWSTHVTMWEKWDSSAPDSVLLRGAIQEGLVYRVDGTPVEFVQEIEGDMAGGMWAWRDGPRWIVADFVEFIDECDKRAPRGTAQKQTPGLLFHLHPERDRRGVVFSSTPGGGLEAWSTEHTAADAAMLIAGGQVDERVIAAAKLGTLPPSKLGVFDPNAPGVLPSGSSVPGVIERLDVDAQPLAVIEGTEVAYSSAGGKVNINQAGPFFYRERYLSLSSAGGGDPLNEITRAYVEAQGTSTMSLTPGASTSVVFGDDVTRPDGTVIPGWRPGDRVSFVDKWTRISEVISGYRITAEHGRLVSAVPILGRQETGVLFELGKRLRAAEREAAKAKLAPPRRLPEQELVAAAAAEATAAALKEAEERAAALKVLEEQAQAEREARAEEERQRQAAQIEANEQVLADLMQQKTVSLFLNHNQTSVENDYIRVTRESRTRIRWNTKSGWVGRVVYVAAFKAQDGSPGFAEGMTMAEFNVPPNSNFAMSGGDSRIGSVETTLTILPGAPKYHRPSIGSRSLPNNQWVDLAVWQVPQTTNVTVSADMVWANKTHVAKYAMEITVDGRNVTTSSSSGQAPLVGHGPRSASVAMSTREIRAGSIIRIRAWAEHANSLNRQIRDAKATISWIDKTAS